MDDLDRLNDRLVANVRDGFPHLLERSFRLGDISEHLVPYRTNRPALRFDSAHQYELALMRLASGERGYLRVEPTVADAFRRALAAPEPDAAVLRDHALATVALGNGSPGGTMAGTTDATAAPPATATYEVPAPVISPMPSPLAVAVPPPEASSGGWPSYDAPSLDAPSLDAPSLDAPSLDATWPPTAVGEPAPPPPPPPPPAPRDTRAPTAGTPPGPTAIGGPCRYCGQPLPEGREVTYCPHCGQNVTVRRCPACSTELEVGWRYCITCGRAMDEGSLHAGGR